MTGHAPYPRPGCDSGALRRQTSREIEAIARSLEPPLPPRKPHFISREDIEINQAEQRCIASLERSHREALAAHSGNREAA